MQNGFTYTSQVFDSPISIFLKITSMKKFVFLFSFLLIVFTVSSCKKKCTEAGTGGNVTLVARLHHHTEPIPNKVSYLDTVYLKFNAKDSPGTNLASYDTYIVGEAGEDHVHIEGLKCGDYYLYAVGFDSTINERVKGGIPYSFDKETGEIDLSIPVTE